MNTELRFPYKVVKIKQVLNYFYIKLLKQDVTS